MSESVPLGLCQCGCGRETRVPRKNDTTHGYMTGVPLRFVRGHSARVINPKRLYLDERSYTVEDRGHDTSCWVWNGKPSPDGYGIYTHPPGSSLAHRRMWEKTNGPIPDGMQLDHLCRVRICVNPAHLEVVTHRENARRGVCVKYSSELISEIRESPELGTHIAKRLGIPAHYIWQIRRRETRIHY